MSKYTTGELAKLCGISVRTVQYYDSRHILIPSELSEGGRRLYTEEDLKKLQIICFLRDMDFSIDNIGELFSDEHSDKVISLLIEQQEETLQKELQEQERKLTQLAALKRALKTFEHFSVQSLGDIAHMMKNQKKRRRMLLRMLLVGIVMDVIEFGTLIYGFMTGIWWPLLAGAPVVIALGILISRYYFTHTAYICPVCHHVFKSALRDTLWAAHTPNTRRLTCPACGWHGFCVEIYEKEEKPC